MRTWRHIFLLLAIGLCGSGAFAGSRNVEDISNLTIHSFAQDLKGYVWIATDNGLCRYNGNDYLHYYTMRKERARSLQTLFCLW